MRRVVFGAALGILTVGMAAPAKDILPFGLTVPTIVTPAQPIGVPTLVSRLGSPSFREREQAGKELLALGDSALPALMKAAKSATDPEIARRLQVLVATIDASRLTTARRVTLTAKEQTARQLVEALAKQSGYAIQFGGGDEGKKYTLDLTDAPFWQALDRVCNETGLQANPNGNDGSLHVYPSDTYSPFTSYDGPYKFLATNVSMNRNVQLSGLPRTGVGPTRNEYLNVQLSVHSEPKAPLVAVGQPRVTRALDESGASLLPPESSPRTTYYRSYGGYYRSYYQHVTVNLYRPNRTATRIAELRGSIPVTVLSGTRPELTIHDVLAAKKQRYPGRTVDLDLRAADYANDTLTLEVTITRRNGDPNDYNWMHAVPHKLQVTDADGNGYVFNGVNSQHNGTNVTTMTLHYRHPFNKKIGKPAKLEFVEWQTITNDVTFAFKDIPLP